MNSKVPDERELIKCEDGGSVYYVPRHVFHRILCEAVRDVPFKMVRYKTGAEMYDMSEREFKEIAREAKATYKYRRMVLVRIDLFEKYLECFHEE